MWIDPWPNVAAGGHAYAMVEPHPGAERDWAEAIVTRAEEQRIADAAVAGELSLAGLVAAEALRIAAWRPRWANEVDDRSLPHETDWLRTAVHLEKGCYRGQETVAKVHNLGHPPRRVVALQLDGSDSVLPAHGDEVFAGDSAVGVVTSAALHFEDGPDRARRGAPQHADRRAARGAHRRRGDRRGAGGHRSARGGGDGEHSAASPARSPSRLSERRGQQS